MGNNEASSNDNYEKYVSNNSEYANYNALTIRLDTQPILERIEFYLRGLKEVYETKNGQVEVKLIRVADSKANDTGVHNIMAWITSTINSQVVQGNFENFQSFYNFIADYRLDLSEYIMNNLKNWAISEEDFEGVIDMILIQVKPFLSRLVNNKERESYTNTIQHRESNTQTMKEKSGGGRFRFHIPGVN